jgi:hypothetical protein
VTKVKPQVFVRFFMAKQQKKNLRHENNSKAKETLWRRNSTRSVLAVFNLIFCCFYGCFISFYIQRTRGSFFVSELNRSMKQFKIGFAPAVFLADLIVWLACRPFSI